MTEAVARRVKHGDGSREMSTHLPNGLHLLEGERQESGDGDCGGWLLELSIFGFWRRLESPPESAREARVRSPVVTVRY